MDTGAAISMVRSSFLSFYEITAKKSSNILVDISGNPLEDLGKIKLVLKVEHVVVPLIVHEFVVCSDNLQLTTDGLLGADFFHLFKATLDFQRDLLVLKDYSVPMFSLSDVDTRFSLGTVYQYVHVLQDSSSQDQEKYTANGVLKDNCSSSSSSNFSRDFCSSAPDVKVLGETIVAGEPQNQSSASSMGPERPLATQGEFLVRLKETITIPGHHRIVCEGLLDARAQEGLYVVEPLSLSSHGILVARVLVRSGCSVFSSGRKVVQCSLVNVSPHEAVVAAKTPVGFAQSADEYGSSSGRKICSISTVDREKLENDLIGSVDLTHINQQDRDKFQKFLLGYVDIFMLEGVELGYTNVVKHRIITQNCNPIAKAPYRVPFWQRPVLKQQVDEMLSQGIISHSDSPWSAPAILVSRTLPGGETKFRFCIDFRALNSVTVRDYFPIPNISETLDSLGGAKRFSTLDLTKGFWQVEIDPRDRHKTGFSVPWGHFVCNRMPFGLINSPSTWQRLMYAVLAGISDEHCFVYMDDIICFSSDEIEEHISKLKLIFDRLRSANLKLNPSKCKFLREETNYLGHVVSKNGVKPDSNKISVIKNYPAPKSIKEVRSFLGLVGFYRKYIERFAHVALPLTHLTKKNVKFEWTKETQKSFDHLRGVLCKEPILKFPDFNKKFILATDASGFAISAILHQVHGNSELPISFASRQLNRAEQRYSATERECLGLVWGIKHFRCYLYGRRFTAIVDHKPLQWLMKIREPNDKLMRWSLLLSEYDFEIKYRPGKQHTNADSLSRIKPIRMLITSGDYEPIWDRDTIRREQHKDKDILELINKVVNDTTNDYYLDVDGMLYKRSEIDREKDKLVVPVKLRSHILKLYHDLPISGHLGIDKTLNKIRMKFIWPGMSNDVKAYVNACEMCAKRKTSAHLRPAPLMKFQPVNRPFERIALDVVGPLVTTYAGNKYILTVQDAFTRYLEAFPMPDQTATTVAQNFVKGIILRHGVPRQILTDLGSNFISKVMQQTCKVLQIDHLHTTAYRPQSNGKLERSHRTLKDMLSHYVDESHKDWDNWVPYAVSAFCSMTHSSLGESPFYLLFGRDIELPYDEILQPIRTRYDTDTNYVSEFLQRMKIAHQKAREHSEIATERMHKNFNKKAAPVNIKTGDRVYLWEPASKQGLSSKLMKKWSGPYRVLEIENVTAKIKEIFGKKEQKVHVNRLKLCLSSEVPAQALGTEPIQQIRKEDRDPIGLPLIEEENQAASPTSVATIPFEEGSDNFSLPEASSINLEYANADAMFEGNLDAPAAQVIPEGTIVEVEVHQPPIIEENAAEAVVDVDGPTLMQPESTTNTYQTRSRGPVADIPWISNNRI